MSGVAAIATPLGNRQVMLWRCGSVGQVNVEMRNLDNQTYTPFKDNGSMKGVVKPSTGLASVVHDNTLAVYGVTTYTDAQGRTGQTVSSLSPIYNPIDSTLAKADPGTSYNAIAAAGSGGDYSYVYFLQDPQSSPQQPLITEYEFNQANPGSRTSYDELNPDPSSNLAAVFESRSGTRMLMFQGYNKFNIYYAWTDVPNKLPISGTNNASKGTPLASALVPFDDGTIEVYLYYVDNNRTLWRTVYTGSKASGIWGAPSAIQKAGQIFTGSGLAVIPDTTRNGNHVYVQTSSGGDYRDIFDGFKQRIDSEQYEALGEAKSCTTRESLEVEDRD